MSKMTRFLRFTLIVPAALIIAGLASAISLELLDDYYTIGPWVTTDLLGDKDGFGLGLMEGDLRPTGSSAFDEREMDDPAFTDVWPVPFTDPEANAFSYWHTFDSPPGPYNARLKILSLGIQDGDEQVSGSDTDIKLYLDGVEVPGAFDDVDQFEFVDGSGWVETVGYVVLEIPADASWVFMDGAVELTYEVLQLGSHTGFDSFAIDFSELVLEPTVLGRTEILAEMVVAFDLPSGLENALLATLNPAISLLENENSEDDIAAINMLLAFLKKVEAKTGRDITKSEADYLTGQVLDILAALAGDQRCPCWGLSDTYALPVEGSTAVCVSDSYTRIDIAQLGICEHSYGVSINASDQSMQCIAQRFDCPGFADMNTIVETSVNEFEICLEQIISRCEALEIEVPEFP